MNALAPPLLPIAPAPGGAFDARADIVFCLAHAFLPPPAQLTGRAWCDALAQDLDELATELGLDAGAAMTALREFAAAAAADEPWLVQYSRLFLVPPAAVTLNTGIYLEGARGGASAQMLTQCYAAAGFMRREDFRDLPDHVAIQLEFIGALLERAAEGDTDAAAMAREFVDGFIRHWVDPLHGACLRAADRSDAARIYASLVDVTRAALDAFS
jgi:TorA maturation chaperone TorD